MGKTKKEQGRLQTGDKPTEKCKTVITIKIEKGMNVMEQTEGLLGWLAKFCNNKSACPIKIH